MAKAQDVILAPSVGQEGPKEVRGLVEKLVSSDGVGVYSTGWATDRVVTARAFGPNHEIE
jgi:hypothetical protein